MSSKRKKRKRREKRTTNFATHARVRTSKKRSKGKVMKIKKHTFSNKMQKICSIFLLLLLLLLLSYTSMLIWLWIFNDSTINVDGSTDALWQMFSRSHNPNAKFTSLSYCFRFWFCGMRTTPYDIWLWLLRKHAAATDKWQWDFTTWYYVAYYTPTIFESVVEIYECASFIQ